VYLGVLAWPEVLVPALAAAAAASAAFFPPVALQAARTRARTAITAIPIARYLVLDI
jgi:hypothetical protein